MISPLKPPKPHPTPRRRKTDNVGRWLGDIAQGLAVGVGVAKAVRTILDLFKPNKP